MAQRKRFENTAEGDGQTKYYWQKLKPVQTKQSNTTPTKDAIEFERYLQLLEKENRMFEMGLAMKNASISTNKEPVCSIEALRVSTTQLPEPAFDRHWYLTRDRLVDDDKDVRNDSRVAANIVRPAIEDNSSSPVLTETSP